MYVCMYLSAHACDDTVWAPIPTQIRSYRLELLKFREGILEVI